MKEYQNVDVLAACEQILWRNHAFCLENLDTLQETMEQAAASERKEDKNLLWLSHTYGSSCFRERDIFLKNTTACQSFLAYDVKQDRVLAYLIEVIGVQDEVLRGNFYKMDYTGLSRHLLETALPAGILRLSYEHGFRDIPESEWCGDSTVQKIWYYGFQFHNIPKSQWLQICCTGADDPVLGKLLGYEFQPQDEEALQQILRQEQERRQQVVRGEIVDKIMGITLWMASQTGQTGH